MAQARNSFFWIVLLAMIVALNFAITPSFAALGDDSAEVAGKGGTKEARPSKTPSETRTPHQDDDDANDDEDDHDEDDHKVEDRPTRNPSETRVPHDENEAEDRPTRNPSETRPALPTRNPLITRTPRPTRDPLITRTPHSTRDPLITRTPRPTRDPLITRTPRPTTTVPAVGRAKGIIEALPSGLMGAWQIGGSSYTANGQTWFQQKSGAFAVGGCVEVKYRVDRTLISVESKDVAVCNG